jgi:hypothetical protein
MDRARAAHRHPAAELCAVKIQNLSDHPQQRHITRHVNGPGLTINSYFVRHDPELLALRLFVSVYLAQLGLNCKQR